MPGQKSSSVKLVPQLRYLTETGFGSFLLLVRWRIPFLAHRLSPQRADVLCSSVLPEESARLSAIGGTENQPINKGIQIGNQVQIITGNLTVTVDRASLAFVSVQRSEPASSSTLEERCVRVIRLVLAVMARFSPHVRARLR